MCSREEYIELARAILSLSIPEKEFIYAERMMACDEGTYSLSFFEAAYQVQIMVNAKYSLADAVRVVAGYVVPLENIEFLIHWEDYQTKLHRYELNAFAAKIEDLNVEGPDLRLAKRFLQKKATKEQQKLFALRVMDSRRRLTDVDRFLGDFLLDYDRNEMELAQLKKHTAKVTLKGDLFRSNKPILPPWSDVDIWDPPEGVRGYGPHYAPEDLDPEICPEAIPTRVNRSQLVASSDNDDADMSCSEDNLNEDYDDTDVDSDVLEKEETTVSSMTIYQQHKGLPSTAIVPSIQLTTDSNHAHDDIVENALVEEEEYEVTDQNPDVFEDEEMYAAMDAEKDRLLAGAAYLPKQLCTGQLRGTTVINLPQNTSNHTGMTAQEKVQLAADSAMLSEAMSYSSFKRELQACEEAMKNDPDGKLLQGAVNRLLESQERIERLELAANNNSGDRNATVIQSGSNLASTSASLPPEFSLPDDIDVNAYSQLIAPHQIEEEWPALTKDTSAAKVQQQPSVSTDNTQPVKPAKNIWVEKNKARKSFMNAGIGGKLPHVKPTTNAFYVDVNTTPSIQDIWGYSLLGQYVGHNPGHYLLNAMIKSWGVRAKYKIEEGWYIFSFESEHDQQKVLIGGPYLIHGRPMLLKNIPDKFAFNRKDLALVPLWVRIYGLASRFWTPEILGGIASYVGCPMYMDPVTDGRKRNAYARVLVELNLAAQISKTVPIEFSDGDTAEVYFLVENQPKFCTDCCSYGHVSSGCQFQSKKPTTTAKDTSNQTVVKTPGNASAAHNNSQQILNTPAGNSISGTDISSHTTGHGIESNRGEDLQLQVYKATTQDIDVTQLQHKGSTRDQEQNEIQGHKTPPQDLQESALSGVHTDLSLANQFAALNDATDMLTTDDNPEVDARTTSNLEKEKSQLATDLKVIENGKGNGSGNVTEQQGIMHVEASTPTNKNPLSNTRNPSSHNRKKASKT